MDNEPRRQTIPEQMTLCTETTNDVYYDNVKDTPAWETTVNTTSGEQTTKIKQEGDLAVNTSAEKDYEHVKNGSTTEDNYENVDPVNEYGHLNDSGLVRKHKADSDSTYDRVTN